MIKQKPLVASPSATSQQPGQLPAVGQNLKEFDIGTSPAVAALTTTTAGSAGPETTTRERGDDPTDDPGGGGSGKISQSKLHKALKRLVRHRRDEDSLMDDVLKIARFAKTKRSRRAGTHVRARNELGQNLSLKEGVGVSISLPQETRKTKKTEDMKKLKK